MHLRFASFVALLLFAAAVLHAADGPRRMPTSVLREAKPAAERLLEACVAGETGAMAVARTELLEVLGPYAGVPEREPVLSEPIDASPVDPAFVRMEWQRTLEAMKGRYPWQREAANVRPRATARWLSALCAIPGAGDSNRALIVEAANHLLAVQARNGVFGFPYREGHDASPGANASKLVTAARDRGIDILENGRIVDDLGTGGLNFDNGETAMALFDAAASTGDTRYRDAALRATEWAVGRPLVANWNYNCFNAWIAARAFRVAGRTNHLDAAVRILRTGVLPGQMDDGNWMDGHNAQPQYRAVMIRACLELCAALRDRNHPYAPELERRTRLALDSLAAHTLRWGHDREKAWEALTIDALATGLRVLGENEPWRRALNVEVHGVLGQRKRDAPLPESMAVFLAHETTRGKAERN